MEGKAEGYIKEISLKDGDKNIKVEIFKDETGDIFIDTYLLKGEE